MLDNLCVKIYAKKWIQGYYVHTAQKTGAEIRERIAKG